jgi:hypothetical protein
MQGLRPLQLPQLLKAQEAKRMLRYISFKTDFRVNYFVLIIPRTKKFLWRGSERECWAACNGLKLFFAAAADTALWPLYIVKKKVSDFPVPSRDVTNQTPTGRE